MSSSTTDQQTPQQENMLINLVFNVVIPTLILVKLSGEEHLGTTWGIVVALLFPISYGLRDFHRRRKINFFSGLGVFSIFLTGGISLLGLDPRYLAIKEAAVPAVFGLATVFSLKTRYPLVRTLLFNDAVIETEKVEAALADQHSKQAFEKMLIIASWIIAGSFFLSSTLNYLLARFIVTSQPGSIEYNAQLGKMTALSFPVIALPATLVMLVAMIYLFRGITHLTGMPFEDIMKHHKHPPAKEDNH
ncbi:MAG: MFS transporter [Gammaproteobacteria bacterium]|nr:MAG: MFS transporter [Gammaproteobacteria bacterium]RLA45552.1 MAG: MFS transporter [Gammaproteobacteria bacterium]